MFYLYPFCISELEGKGRAGAVGLHAAGVEVVDLGVGASVTEVALGDVPEVVVVPALRRLDDVDPLADQLRTGLLVELGIAEHVAHVLLALRIAVGCAGARSGRPGGYGIGGARRGVSVRRRCPAAALCRHWAAVVARPGCAGGS